MKEYLRTVNGIISTITPRYTQFFCWLVQDYVPNVSVAYRFSICMDLSVVRPRFVQSRTSVGLRIYTVTAEPESLLAENGQ